MCGITGFSNLTKDISSYRYVLNNMTDALKKRGPDEEGVYIDKHIALGHRRLIVIDPNFRQTAYASYLPRKYLHTCL